MTTELRTNIQETKSILKLKQCWGTQAFNYIHLEGKSFIIKLQLPGGLFQQLHTITHLCNFSAQYFLLRGDLHNGNKTTQMVILDKDWKLSVAWCAVSSDVGATPIILPEGMFLTCHLWMTQLEQLRLTHQNTAFMVVSARLVVAFDKWTKLVFTHPQLYMDEGYTYNVLYYTSRLQV